MMPIQMNERNDMFEPKMGVLWPTVVAPLLEACRPSTIVELGRDDALGEMLDEAAHELGCLILREEQLSTTQTGAPDFALVHGEPNWHTVTDRLDRLSEMAQAGDAPFPVTLVHGVDWPTGRRDSYPNPGSIPAGEMQPHREEGGTERALDRHELRNGVLTAVEDFLDRTGADLELIHIPGLGGIALLVPEPRLRGADSHELVDLVGGWRLSPQALAQLAAVDAERVRAAIEIDELWEELEGARAGIAVQSSAADDTLRRRIDELAARHAELTEALARRDARLAALEANGRPAPTEQTEAATVSPTPASGDTTGLGEPSQPLPIDRRGILLAHGEDPAPGSEPLHAVVRVEGEVDRLRRCLWSLLARTDRRLRLTLATGSATDDAREFAHALAAAEPAIRIVEGEAEVDLSEWRLCVDAPVEFGHGAIRNLVSAARVQNPACPVAAVSAEALGMPPWAGPETLALLLDGESVAASTAPIAAACTLLAPGTPNGAAETVALDAVVCTGEDAVPDPELPGQGWLRDALADETGLCGAMRERLRRPLSIAYVLPGLPAEGSGGSQSVFQEARALRSLGVPVKVLVESEFSARATSLYPEVEEMIQSYGSPRAFDSALAGIDVVVATEAPSARLVEAHVRSRDGVLGAYYVQDYEPLFSPQEGPSADTALLSYRQAESLLMFAKTHWIANMVGSAHRIPVAKVTASLDQGSFHTRGRKVEPDPLRVLGMIRPRTPRRRPEETLAALARIKRELGDRVECLGFGCTMGELAALPHAAGVEHLGVLARTDVAEVLRRCDVFLDLSTYQAFGRTGLQAIACGVVPVLPEVGGVVEYAVHEGNALLVDTADEDAVVALATGLVEDKGRLERLRANGAETAERFSLIRAAASQYACFAEGFAAMHEGGS
jgi:glycosyltransferase involved in cell wall biosynthesis